ncbi:MAG: AI-2E family transporter [Chloroflexaceae bacterium]|nr:AI-2E family transporter [Chloroflexaceae bacterium]
MPTRIEISRNTWFALFTLGLAFGVTYTFSSIIVSITVLLLLSALLALLINPLANWLEQRGIKRGVTVGGVLLIVVVAAAVMLLIIAPIVYNSLIILYNNLVGMQAFFAPFLPDLTTYDGSITSIVSNSLAYLGGAVGGVLGQVGATLFMLFVMVVLVFALVAEPSFSRGLLDLFVPVQYHARLIHLTDSVSSGLARWFVAQVAISFYYIVCYGIINLILGIPFALTIAVIGGVLEFIPYLGGIVGMALSVLAALSAGMGWTTILWLVILETIVGAVAVYFVAPYFFARAIKVQPALVLLGLFVGGQVGGFLAALLTVPIITVIVVLVREIRTDPADTEVIEAANGGHSDVALMPEASGPSYPRSGL